jgi:nucleotide-binding universal stress UspA family protein
MYKNILIPLDGSRRAEAILSSIETLARQHKSRVIFLCVKEPPTMLGRDEVIDVTTYRKMRKKRQNQATSYLTNLKEEYNAKGIEAEFQIAYGSVVKSILNTAETANCDLIALATRGLNGSLPVMRSSVAVGLMQKADCPLLLIRNNGTL